MKLIQTTPTENQNIVIDNYSTELSINDFDKALSNIQWTLTPNYNQIVNTEEQQKELEAIVNKILEEKTLPQQIEIIFGQSGYITALGNIILNDSRFETENGLTKFQFQSPRVITEAQLSGVIEKMQLPEQTPISQPLEVETVENNG